MRRAWPSAFAWLLLLFSAHILLNYFSGALMAGLLSTALLALSFLTAAGCGRILLRYFRISGVSESEKTLIGATLGLGLLSQGVMALGLLGALKPWAVSVLLGLFWVIGFTELKDILSSLGANRNLLRERPVLGGGILCLLALLLWFSWVPPHQYDSLVYHLALPSAYLRQGNLVAVEHLLYSHFPQNGEMLYTFALLLGSDILAQMFTWLGTFLSVWWLFEMGKRETPIVAVLFACFFTLTHTAVMLLTPTAYVECLVMLWITAAVLSFMRWRMSSDIEISHRGWLALAGVFAGLGVGTKYYAGICPALIGSYLGWQWLRMRPWEQGGSYVQGRLLDAAAFSCAAFVFGLPWLIKNALVLGNPVFPFLYDIFPARGIGWGAESAAGYFSMLTEYRHQKGRLLLDLLQFPYLAAAGSQRFGGGADVLGGHGWGLLLAAFPVAAWAARESRYLRGLLFYCVAHGLLWFQTGVILRFLTVLVPLLSLGAACGLYKVWERLGAGSRGALAAGCSLFVLANVGIFLFVNVAFGSLPVLTGYKGRRQYLSEKLDYFPCADYARARLDQNDRILVVGEFRGYYVEQPHATTRTNAPNAYVREANASADARDFSRRLKAEGFKHLLFVPREAKRLNDGWGVFHFSEKGAANWEGLISGGLADVFEAPGRCWLKRIL